MGRPRKIKSVKALEEAWTEYKLYCDHQAILTHEFSAKNSKFVSGSLQRKITYTIEGFCVFIGMSRSSFYASYRDDDKYSDTVTRMREECEVDARMKFETGQIPSQLAGLWMSNYGYTTKTDTKASVTGTQVVIVDDLDE